MLKSQKNVNGIFDQAEAQIRKVLARVPFVKVEEARRELLLGDLSYRADILLRLDVQGRSHTLVCEVKKSGQPRFVREGILQLRHYLASLDSESTAVIVAPYLSPESQAICIDNNVGFVDFEGNCRLVFDGTFIERFSTIKPPAAKRYLKSLFSPKSARVLRALLCDPSRLWLVKALAEAAQVSLGQVSNVRTALLNQEWAAVQDGGFRLSKPAELLDAWRDAYKPVSGQHLGLYTPLHGRALEDATREALQSANMNGAAMLASFSAAQWLSAYARTGMLHLYADGIGLEHLTRHLGLLPVRKGENVAVVIPHDHGLFLDRSEPAPGVVCTSPVQTYLDLSAAGERGREAAEHLRKELLAWPE